MPDEIIPINLAEYSKFSANCYLIRTSSGYFLIDTGPSKDRAALEKALEGASCRPGSLKLVVITHGDFDHTGNCAYLRETYGARIAIHPGESAVVEAGDMFLSRKGGNGLRKVVTRIALSIFKLLTRFDRFKPDIYVEDGADLSIYGLDAKVLHIPGHSQGSVGVLMASGDLFCGDLFTNINRPVVNSLIDDRAQADASAERLRGLEVRTVYPGHGRPFPLEAVGQV